MTLQELRQNLANSKWTSISIEERPSLKPDGGIKSSYWTRYFTYGGDDTFFLRFTSYGDPFGKIPLAEMDITGHFTIGASHPITPGAFDIHYVADLGFTVKPLNDQFAAALNSLPLADGLARWEAQKAQDVLRKAVPAFGLVIGKFFEEYDLIYLRDNLYFNGSRHADGRPFDSPANRPTNLQIPLLRIDA